MLPLPRCPRAWGAARRRLSLPLRDWPTAPAGPNDSSLLAPINRCFTRSCLPSVRPQSALLFYTRSLRLGAAGHHNSPGRDARCAAQLAVVMSSFSTDRGAAAPLLAHPGYSPQLERAARPAGTTGPIQCLKRPRQGALAARRRGAGPRSAGGGPPRGRSARGAPCRDRLVAVHSARWSAARTAASRRGCAASEAR